MEKPNPETEGDSKTGFERAEELQELEGSPNRPSPEVNIEGRTAEEIIADQPESPEAGDPPAA